MSYDTLEQSLERFLYLSNQLQALSDTCDESILVRIFLRRIPQRFYSVKQDILRNCKQTEVSFSLHEVLELFRFYIPSGELKRQLRHRGSDNKTGNNKSQQ